METKKTGTFKGQSNKLGKGGRSAQLKAKGLSGALIAYIGKQKYGKDRMAKWAASERKEA